MQNKNENITVEQRLAALEHQQREILGQLDDIRETISSGFDVLFEGNGNRAEAIRTICDRLAKVEERLTPTFFQVFPRQREFLCEIEAAFHRGKRD